MKNRRRSVQWIRIKRRIYYWLRVFFILLVILAVLWGGWWFFTDDLFLIDKVHIVGDIESDYEQRLASIAGRKLEGRYGGVIPRRHLAFYPRLEIKRVALEQLIFLADIETRASFSGVLTLEVRQREVEKLWCQKYKDYDNLLDEGKETEEVPIAEDCYFVDTGGVVFAPAPEMSENIITKLYARNSLDPIGGRPLTEEEWFDLKERLEVIPLVLNNLGLTEVFIGRVKRTVYGDFQFVVTDRGDQFLGERWDLILPEELSMVELVGLLETIWQTEKFQKDVEESGHDLKYLDLRFNPRVYYYTRS